MTQIPVPIPLEFLLASPTNPRKTFDRESLEELAKSIHHDGLLYPLIVRPWPDQSDEFQGCFEIVSGERRYRASEIASKFEGSTLKEVYCFVRELSDDDVLRIQIIENLQRKDIHPLEEADGFKKLVDRGVETVTTIAHKVGKSEEYVFGRIKLASLAGRSRLALEQGLLPIGHAILIAKLGVDDQDAAAESIGVRVRDDGTVYTAWVNGVQPIRELRSWIERQLVLDLAAAKFSLEDPDLNPVRGACTTCPLRTANNAVLFPELGGSDRCTDRKCFDGKLGAHMDRKRAELEAQGDVITISESYSRPSVEGAIPSSRYTRIPTESEVRAGVIEDRDDDLFGWILDLEEEGFTELAPRTFAALVDACRRGAGGYDFELHQDPPAVEFNDVRYTQADDGYEWPDVDAELNIEAPVPSEGVVMALMVDGPDKGEVVPVVLRPQATQVSSSGEATDDDKAKRAEAREEGRKRRAEMNARRRIFDCVLTMLTPDRIEEHSTKLLTVVALKAATLDTNVWDSQDPKTGKHPGRSHALGLIGAEDRKWSSGKPENFPKVPELDAWRAIFVAVTSDEIHVGQYSHDRRQPTALLVFADAAGVDVELIRKEEDWNTLSKKQQAERSKSTAPKVDPDPQDFAAGMVVATSYGTGPYEITAATRSSSGWNLTLKSWGSKAKQGDAFINGVKRHEDGGWTTGLSRLYIVSAEVEPLDGMRPLSSFERDTQLGLADGAEIMVGGDRCRLIAANIVPDNSGELRRFVLIVRSETNSPWLAKALRASQYSDGTLVDHRDCAITAVAPTTATAADKMADAFLKSMRRIGDDELDVLARCRVEGTIVFLPEGQLERKLYERVDAVLQALGGKWNRSKKGHVFAEDPEEALQSAINNGAIVDRKKALQFFPTPAAVAARLVELAEIFSDGLSILEPSAGKGAIVREAIKPAHDLSKVVAVEIDETHQEDLEGLGVDVYQEDFLVTSREYLGHPEGFDRVVMNPPFTRQQDVDHVLHAFGMLAPGGVLVSVMSPSWLFRENAKSRDFKAFVEQLGGEVVDLPEGSFLESGTAVRSVILKLRAPFADERAVVSFREPVKEDRQVRNFLAEGVTV